MTNFKDFKNKRNEYSSYEEYMEKEFPNYAEGYVDVCNNCKEPISKRTKLENNNLCNKCKEEFEK